MGRAGSVADRPARIEGVPQLIAVREQGSFRRKEERLGDARSRRWRRTGFWGDVRFLL
jgi:hypothetical protein